MHERLVDDGYGSPANPTSDDALAPRFDGLRWTTPPAPAHWPTSSTPPEPPAAQKARHDDQIRRERRRGRDPAGQPARQCHHRCLDGRADGSPVRGRQRPARARHSAGQRRAGPLLRRARPAPLQGQFTRRSACQRGPAVLATVRTASRPAQADDRGHRRCRARWRHVDRHHLRHAGCPRRCQLRLPGDGGRAAARHPLHPPAAHRRPLPRLRSAVHRPRLRCKRGHGFGARQPHRARSAGAE